MVIIQANHDPFFQEINNPWNFGGEKEVEQVHNFMKKGKVMDLWFWVWRHVKQLLNLWHEVEWIELSKIWYTRLINEMNDLNQTVTLYHWDMFEYEFTNRYDCIFANMTLQYANSKKQFNEMIEKIKNITNNWGINYIKLPAQWMTLDFPYKIGHLEELIWYYSDWDILFNNQEKILKKDGNLGVYISIIARKKS